MPPKKKEPGKKVSLVRQPISDLSLILVPEDAVKGYQKRIETGIEWTLIEEAARHHKELCMLEEIPTRTFSEAVQKKIDNSILGGFLNKDSNMSPSDYWETIVTMAFWEQEKFATEEEKTCFQSKNFLTNDIDKVVKKAVRLGDREALRDELTNAPILRVNDAKISEVDNSIFNSKRLYNLTLCGNYIKVINGDYLPQQIKMLELQANGISNINSMVRYYLRECFYLGLARNLLNDASMEAFPYLPYNLNIIDLGDNDICSLPLVLEALSHLPTLVSLTLAGNPCSVCAAYMVATLRALPTLKWLDNRKILETDYDPPLPPKAQPLEIHPDDLRSAYFFFKVIRIMTTPQPPKQEKGATGTFHIELEIPLLDSKRRSFLMFRDNEFLVEYIPEPEGGWPESELMKLPSTHQPTTTTRTAEEESHASDIYRLLELKDNRTILNYKVFESNRIQWNNVMTFQDPTIRIFCPDLKALRDTFRTVITIRYVYTVTISTKVAKDKTQASLPPPEFRVVLATIKCVLQRLDWSQKAQHFHWDSSMATNEAIHWGDGDLEVLQYIQQQGKAPKSSKDTEQIPKQQLPENMTCHFSFGIERLQ